jgi:hypothetical protein
MGALVALRGGARRRERRRVASQRSLGLRDGFSRDSLAARNGCVRGHYWARTSDPGLVRARQPPLRLCLPASRGRPPRRSISPNGAVSAGLVDRRVASAMDNRQQRGMDLDRRYSRNRIEATPSGNTWRARWIACKGGFRNGHLVRRNQPGRRDGVVHGGSEVPPAASVLRVFSNGFIRQPQQKQ